MSKKLLFSQENLWYTDIDKDIARRCRRISNISLSGQLNPDSVYDTGGDIDLQCLFHAGLACTTAISARILDDRAPAMTGGAD